MCIDHLRSLSFLAIFCSFQLRIAILRFCLLFLVAQRPSAAVAAPLHALWDGFVRREARLHGDPSLSRLLCCLLDLQLALSRPVTARTAVRWNVGNLVLKGATLRNSTCV